MKALYSQRVKPMLINSHEEFTWNNEAMEEDKSL